MRTTVTFEPDVQARIPRLQGDREFKSFINEILRLGLDQFEQLKDRAALGIAEPDLPLYDVRPLVNELDNVHRLLDELEAEDGRLRP